MLPFLKGRGWRGSYIARTCYFLKGPGCFLKISQLLKDGSLLCEAVLKGFAECLVWVQKQQRKKRDKKSKEHMSWGLCVADRAWQPRAEAGRCSRRSLHLVLGRAGGPLSIRPASRPIEGTSFFSSELVD